MTQFGLHVICTYCTILLTTGDARDECGNTIWSSCNLYLFYDFTKNWNMSTSAVSEILSARSGEHEESLLLECDAV